MRIGALSCSFVVVVVVTASTLVGCESREAREARLAESAAARNAFAEAQARAREDEARVARSKDTVVDAGRPSSEVDVAGAAPTTTADAGAPAVQKMCAEVDGKTVCVDVVDRGEEPEPSDAPPTSGPARVAKLRPPDPNEKRVVNVNKATAARVPSSVWPNDDGLHPAVVSIGERDEQSLESLALHIEENTRPGFDRLRALHDWVAHRIAYDVEAMRTRRSTPQDAESVFARRVARSEGYARLMVRLGELVDESVHYVSGTAKDVGGTFRQSWNAARVDDGYVLIDTEWDAGCITRKGKFKRIFRTDYAFAPPELFIASHLPNEEHWQLLDDPIDRAEFLRAPTRRVAAFKSGLTLVEPSSTPVSSGRSVKIVVDNPKGRDLSATSCFAGVCTPCGSARSNTLTCDLDQRGDHQVNVFVNPDPRRPRAFRQAFGFVTTRR